MKKRRTCGNLVRAIVLVIINLGEGIGRSTSVGQFLGATPRKCISCDDARSVEHVVCCVAAHGNREGSGIANDSTDSLVVLRERVRQVRGLDEANERSAYVKCKRDDILQ